MNKATLREWLEQRIEEQQLALKAAEQNLYYLSRLLSSLPEESEATCAGYAGTISYAKAR